MSIKQGWTVIVTCQSVTYPARLVPTLGLSVLQPPDCYFYNYYNYCDLADIQ